MDDEDFIHRAAYFLAKGASPLATPQALDGLSSVLVFAHHKKYIDLLGDLEVAARKVEEVFDAMEQDS